MDAIDNNVRVFLHLPQRPQPWQRSQGNRTVHAAVQSAIVAQHYIGWDKFLAGFLSPAWEVAQVLYHEITGDYPPRPPPAWADTLLPVLWDFSHDLWTYRNEIKHGATALEQATQVRARVVALVTDRYRHRPHLAPRYTFLYKKSLPERLLEGNRALFTWLSSVANLSSISSGPCQTSINAHATFQRLSYAALGRLRRPLRRRRRLKFPSPKKRTGKFALGQPVSRYSPSFLTAHCSFTPRKPPMPLKPAPRRKKMFKSSINSHAARLIFDRGRSARHLI